MLAWSDGTVFFLGATSFPTVGVFPKLAETVIGMAETVIGMGVLSGMTDTVTAGMLETASSIFSIRK
jgi:hypothetical protein